MIRHFLAALLGGAVVHGAHTLLDTPDAPAYAALVETVAAEEGFRGRPYDDTRGHATIGYGTLLPLSRDEARALLASRLAANGRELAHIWPPFADVPEAGQAALVDLAYVVGPHGALGFHRMLDALAAGQFARAADEVLDSRFAHEDPARAKRIAEALRGL